MTLINTKDLKSQAQFAEMCKVSRQNIGQMIEKGTLNSVEIDGTPYIILDQKANNYLKKKRGVE